MHNKVQLRGKLYTLYPQEKVAIVEVERRSGIIDNVQVLYNNETVELAKLVDKDITVDGIIFTTNTMEEGKRHLNIYCKGTILPDYTLFDDVNEVEFTGFLVKPPVNRNTPLGRIITELHFAINDKNNVSYYVPTITFDKVAANCINYRVGDKLTIRGRLQSRMYEKVVGEQVITKTAYEVAARSVYIAKEEQDCE